MIFDVVKLAIGAGTHIMKNRQQRKMLESDAAMLHAQKWLTVKLNINKL